MEYKVINPFKDKENDNTRYNVGDPYPKGDLKTSKKRIEELSKKHSKHNVAFIAPVITDGEKTDGEPVETEEEKAVREAQEAEEKEAVKAELESLGVSFHPNTGLEKLNEKLVEARAEQSNKE